MKKTGLSYSRLTTFESCPAKFDYVYFSKTVKDVPNVHSEYGVRVHEALEQYGRDGTPLTEETKHHKALVDKFLSLKGEKYFEHQMALTEDRKPCDWFDKEVWFRGIADVLVVNGKKATIIDWKTGKVKNDPTQVKIFANMVMEHFPEVEVVKTVLAWIKFNEFTIDEFHRKDLQQSWASLMPRIDYVHETIDLGVFKTKPSGLCDYCPAQSRCPDARYGRRYKKLLPTGIR